MSEYKSKKIISPLYGELKDNNLDELYGFTKTEKTNRKRISKKQNNIEETKSIGLEGLLFNE